MTQTLVFALAERMRPLASQLAKAIDAEIVLPAKAEDIRTAFSKGQNVVAIMAAGALIRIIAPCLNNKHEEPALIAISEDGHAVVPLLGGHHGANGLARLLGEKLGVEPAITTASDCVLGVSLDEPPKGFVLDNPERVKPVVSALLDKAEAQISTQAHWLQSLKQSDAAKVKLSVDVKLRDGEDMELIYRPQQYVLGMGCERFCDFNKAIQLAEEAIEKSGISSKCLAAVTSLDLKADEEALRQVAAHFDVPFRVFDAETLEAETPRLENPSDVVFKEVGCHGVAEASALAAVGQEGCLVVPKIKNGAATAAIAKAKNAIAEVEFGRAQGRLFVVGLGPGQASWRSPEVSQMLRQASDWVGYSLYLDLASDQNLNGQKIRHDFPLGDEEKRVRHALELAGEGKDVALICSGDAGIYAMATLVFEVLDKGDVSDAAKRTHIQCSPGISALQGAAARAGAPLGHDFCTISLSDLLTPWEAIQKRLKAAAEGDFVIAFYNPVSKRRRTQLAYAKDVLLEHRPQNTPVILASSLGRPEENVRVVTLGDLQIDDVDMLTTVVVGSSQSQIWQSGSGKKWVYTPRGYAAKMGSTIEGQS